MDIKEPPRSIPSTPRDPRSKSWLDFYTLEKKTSFRLNTHPIFFGKKRTFFVYFLDTLTYCWFFSPSIIILTKAEVQKEVLSKRSNWTGWKASQACAQQSSQMDCNIKLTHPTRTIQKLTEDLSEGKSKPSSTFFRNVLDTYSVIENQCKKTILKKCYHL